MKKFIPFFTLIFVISMMAISTYRMNNKQAIPQNETSEEGEREEGIHFAKTNIALPEFSLPDLYDSPKEFSKKDLTAKYSIINFFASWCATCRAEHEILLRLKDEKIIDIYGIAWRDIDENTKSYLQKSGNPFKKVAKDSRGLFTQIAGIQAIPETWIVDEKGIIVRRFRGNLQDFSIDEIRNFLNSKK